MDAVLPLPRDHSIEAAVLGAIIIQPERFTEVASALTPSVMDKDAHRLIAEAAHAAHAAGAAPDLLTLKGELERRGVLERAGGVLYLSTLTDGVPRGTNLPQSVTRLKELSESRDVVRALTHTAREVAANGASPDILGPLAEALRRIGGPTETPRLRFSSAAEVMDAPPAAEVVEGIAWASKVTAVIGSSGSGKTFFTYSIGAHVGWGERLHGRRVRRASVANLAYERDGIGLRLRALEQFHRRPLENFYAVHAEAPLSPRIGRDGLELPSPGELAATDALEHLSTDLERAGAPPLGLVIVDTARASMTGSEDSSDNVSAYLRALVRMTRRACPDAAVLVTHHSGWNDGPEKRRRERGSSAWRGNVDGTVFVEAGEPDPSTRETPITIEALKVRDGDRPADLRLVRRVIDLGFGADGRPLSSCIVDADRNARERATRQEAATVAEAGAFDLRVLRTIMLRPDVATTVDRVRQVLSVRKEALGAAMSRLLDAGWVNPPSGRGKPYTVTDEGRTALLEAAK